jgi:leader peptidase (prepilin peptidase)/N-methyltransferase
MAFIIIFFLFGLVFGSFANVCIWRLPRNEEVVLKPSHCPECNAFIKWYHNIPLLSYLMLRGKCSSCGKRIPLRYPAVELLSGLFFVAAYIKFGLDYRLIGYLPFLWAMLAISAIDIEHYIIPDILSLPGIVLGLALAGLASFRLPLHLSVFGYDDPFFILPIFDGLLGAAIGGGFIWLSAWAGEKIFKQEAMGGGDIKLAAMIGAFLGWQAVLMSLFLAFLTGTLAGLPLLLTGHLKKPSQVFPDNPDKREERAMIPFGPFLALGGVMSIFLGPAIWRIYYSFLSK